MGCKVPQTVVVTFKVPIELVEKLDELVRLGVFKNRSEALRHALVMLLTKYRSYGGVAAVEEVSSGGYGEALPVEKNNRKL